MIKFIQGTLDLFSSIMKKYGLAEDVEIIVAHEIVFNRSSKKWEVKNLNSNGIIVDMVYFKTKEKAENYLNTFYPQNSKSTKILNKQ